MRFIYFAFYLEEGGVLFADISTWSRRNKRELDIEGNLIKERKHLKSF